MTEPRRLKSTHRAEAAAAVVTSMVDEVHGCEPEAGIMATSALQKSKHGARIVPS